MSRVRSALLVGSFVLYPILIHVLIMRRASASAVAVLVAVSAVLMTAHLLAPAPGRGVFWAGAYGLLATVGVVSLAGNNVYALFLPHLFINLTLAASFGATLQGRATPIIERFMRLIHRDHLPPALARYARRLTLVWTVFFSAMALTGLALARYSSLEAWSLFTNVINYLLVAALFVLQFLYSYVRYRDQGAVSPWKGVRLLVWRLARDPQALSRRGAWRKK